MIGNPEFGRQFLEFFEGGSPTDNHELGRLFGPVLQKLGMEPRDLMRKNEAEYKANGLDDQTLDRQALINGMVSHPILIERPIVIANDKAAIGRPPEAVLSIL